MRSGRLWLRLLLVLVLVALVWKRLVPPHATRTLTTRPTADLSVTMPLNQTGGSPAPADAYEVYSALYQTSMNEPLAFSQDSVTDIPQVDGSCLKPTTPKEREITDAFVAANRQSHRWEQKFSIPQGYQLFSRDELSQVRDCQATHGRDVALCGKYKQLSHVRLLGVPGFDQAHTQALVSVIKSCGRLCGTGGIFAVEKTASGWQRSATTDFTRDCSWMY
jgi:hypothetical protein